MFIRAIWGWVLLSVVSVVLVSVHAAGQYPGNGVQVQPMRSTLGEEDFQACLVDRAMRELGYQVLSPKRMTPEAGHLAVGVGDISYMAVHWKPLHTGFYQQAGGNEHIFRQGVFVGGGVQGYLIDKQTAVNHNIKYLDQLKDPHLAHLFDWDGDGKADLVGCGNGWACTQVIDHHLQAYGLTDTVQHHKYDYMTMLSTLLKHQQQGKPILYYAWTPHWLSAILVPGKDSQWLQVPFSALPQERADEDTSFVDGSNYGFKVNSQHIIANKAFIDQNPAAARLFSIMEISPNDISAQNLKMRHGEDSAADIERHVDNWIKQHQDTFEGWLKAAREAAS